MSNKEFITTYMSCVKLEDMKYVMEALADHLGLELQISESFYGEPEFRFVEKST